MTDVDRAHEVAKLAGPAIKAAKRAALDSHEPGIYEDFVSDVEGAVRLLIGHAEDVTPADRYDTAA